MTFSSSSGLILPRRNCLTEKRSGLHANAYGRNEKCPSCHGLILLPRVLRSQNGESGEGCARFFQSRKTLSKHACVRRGVIDVKTGTAVQVPVPITNSSSVPPVTATSGGSQSPLPFQTRDLFQNQLFMPAGPVVARDQNLGTLNQQ